MSEMKKEEILNLIEGLTHKNFHKHVSDGGFAIHFDPGEPHNSTEVFRDVDPKMFKTSENAQFKSLKQSEYAGNLSEEEKQSRFNTSNSRADIMVERILEGNADKAIYDIIAKYLESIRPIEESMRANELRTRVTMAFIKLYKMGYNSRSAGVAVAETLRELYPEYNERAGAKKLSNVSRKIITDEAVTSHIEQAISKILNN